MSSMYCYLLFVDDDLWTQTDDVYTYIHTYITDEVKFYGSMSRTTTDYENEFLQ